MGFVDNRSKLPCHDPDKEKFAFVSIYGDASGYEVYVSGRAVYGMCGSRSLGRALHHALVVAAAMDGQDHDFGGIEDGCLTLFPIGPMRFTTRVAVWVHRMRKMVAIAISTATFPVRMLLGRGRHYIFQKKKAK